MTIRNTANGATAQCRVGDRGPEGVDRPHHRPDPRRVRASSRRSAPGVIPRPAVPSADPRQPRWPLTPATITELLERHGLAPSRALGQNFLADPNTARRIVRLAGVEAGDRVLEIGPGIGSLTVALPRPARAVDRARARPAPGAGAARRRSAPDAITLVAGRRADGRSRRAARRRRRPPWRAVSNLPYNVATPIVMRLLEDAPSVTSMLVMVQREVGERLAAGPGSKDYGAMSVKVAYFAAARVVGIVPPTVFMPAAERRLGAGASSSATRQPPVDGAVARRVCSRSCAPGSRSAARCCRRALRTELGDDASRCSTPRASTRSARRGARSRRLGAAGAGGRMTAPRRGRSRRPRRRSSP